MKVIHIFTQEKTLT